MFKQPFPGLHGLFMTQSHSDQCHSLLSNQIAGGEELLIGFDKTDCKIVKPVGPIYESEEGGCVNEDWLARRASERLQGFSCK